MSLNLTTRAQLTLDKTNVEPVIILRIDGIDLLFGSTDVFEISRYDTGLFYDDDLLYDDTTPSSLSRPFISIKGKTTKSIQQQIKQEAGVSSISNFTVELVNKDNQLAKTFIPGNLIPDLLGRNADIFIGFLGTAFPEDVVQIFSGTISNFSYGPGKIVINVTHPGDLVRQDAFVLAQTELTANINNTTTVIPVLSTNGFLLSQDVISSYIKIEDEIMELVSKTPNSFTVVRGALGTTAASYDTETEVSSFYIATEKPLELALKLMLSGANEYYSTLDIRSIGSVNNTLTPNSIEFSNADLLLDIGLTVGDTVTITDSANPSNNTTVTVIEVGKSPSTSFVRYIGAALVNEGSGAKANFRSRYNVLADGAQMLPRHIDIDQFEFYIDNFSGNFPTYSFYFKDTISIKEFIEKEVLSPVGLYSIPRKGRISVGYTLPPLAANQVPKLQTDNIVNVGQLEIARSTKSGFYNAIVHRYNEQLLDDKFLAGEILVSAEAIRRVPSVKNRPLVFNSKGLKKSPDTINIINRIQSRLLARYELGAQTISKVQVLFKDGFKVEPGDIVSFGNAKIIDPNTGELIVSKLFEVSNKSMDIISGNITLDLIDTSFQIGARFGVISPSSRVGAGSTTTLIVLTQSYNTQDFETESAKWVQYVGQRIKIHNDDYSIEYDATLLAIDNGVFNSLTITPIAMAPTTGLIVDLDDYNEASDQINQFSKSAHAYINPTGEITNGIDNFTFEVASASIFLVGQVIQVHDEDFINSSDETVIEEINGNEIIVRDDLGFTPSSGDYVELIGFLDGGDPYRML